MNAFKTFLLMLGLLLVLMYLGSCFGEQGMFFALLFGCLFNFGAYWFSDKLVLAMSRAKPMTEAEAPALYHMVRELTQRSSLPMPKLYLLPMPTPNAFATGRSRSRAAVAVSPSLVDMLSPEELKGVVAHELAHIKNRDTLIATVAACLAGTISYLAHMIQWGAIFGGFGGRNRDSNAIGALAMAIVAPIAALLIQLAISRSREFAADAGAAHMTHEPTALANALRKIHTAAARTPLKVEPAPASLYIANPLSGRSLMKWFSTHPPVEERIRRLQEMR